MAKYLCIRPCFHNSRRYRRGDVVEFADGQWPKDKGGKIRHFEAVETAKTAEKEASVAGAGEIPVKVNTKEIKGK